MNLTISGHHLELTPAIREYVQDKLERIKRHFDHIIDVAVVLSIDTRTEKKNDSVPKLIYTCVAKTCMLKARRKICMRPSICSSTNSTAKFSSTRAKF